MLVIRKGLHVQSGMKAAIFQKRLNTNSSWETFQEKFLTPAQQKITENYWKEAVTDIADGNQADALGAGLPKKYIVAMFPYPSGQLHLGHARVYTISDAIARFYRMKGWKVIHPMGWDAFGLPAENAAMERGENPRVWTRGNISRMRKQIRDLGCGFDWGREVATCEPQYYRWTQFIFLKLFEAGLAYRQQAVVNWDPVDLTVLANEQVDETGCSWRSGARIEKKLLTQWFIKTTSLSKELYEDLSDPCLVNWRDVPAMQRNWIGESTGYIVEMPVQDGAGRRVPGLDHLSVWMAEPELLGRVAFLAVKSEHILNTVSNHTVIQGQAEGGDRALLGVVAVDPLSGRRIPIVATDALDYGEDRDLYVGVPASRSEDGALCRQLGLDALLQDPTEPPQTASAPTRDCVITRLKELKAGGYASSGRLRDWLISRQRYWGTPIPIVYCRECGTVPVPEGDLPVELPEFEGNVHKGKSVLAENEEWRRCPCPRCGGPADRETDTMDTFVDSSWYFLRYLDPQNETRPVDTDLARTLMPVDLYIGGKEHATLHLYYARFMHKFLSMSGLASHKEPFEQLLLQGMMKGRSFRVQETGRYLRNEEVDFEASPPVEKESGGALVVQFEKMSKSRHNGVDPQSLLDEYGIDAVRLAMLANAGPQSERLWNHEDMKQSFQILTKLWGVARVFVFVREGGGATPPAKSDSERAIHNAALFEARNQLVSRATYNFEVTMQFHNAIRSAQQLIVALLRVPKSEVLGSEYEKTLRSTLLILSPVCPHITAELWKRVDRVTKEGGGSEQDCIFRQPWPSIDPSYQRELTFKVNNEDVCVLRMDLPEYSVLSQEKAMQLACEHESMKPLLEGASVLGTEFNHFPAYKAFLSIRTNSRFSLKKKKKERQKAAKAA